MGKLIRLRGEGPHLVWPEVALRPHLTRRSELRDCCPQRSTPCWERRQWEAASVEAHEASVCVFAKAQGWRPSQEFALERLLGKRGSLLWAEWATYDVVDHPDYLCQGGHSPALVVHLYGSLVLERVPRTLIVDQLPESWYWPEITTAYVSRPALSVTIQHTGPCLLGGAPGSVEPGSTKRVIRISDQ